MSNRIIKFRAWSIPFNRWSYGLPTYIMGSQNGNVLPDTYLSSFIEGGSSEMVAGSTLSQWTGLKDKNGTEIYEGDTATKTFTEKVGKHTVERTVSGEVVWSTKKAGFALLVKDYVSPDVFDQKHYELDGITVTGNIHQLATTPPNNNI